MSDKYNSFKKDVFIDSTYQMLVEPRNKALEHLGATYYNVVDSKLVECNGNKKDIQIFYDTNEFYTINDRTPDDKWGGQTTTAIVTFNTLEKPGDLDAIKLKNKLKEQLSNAISHDNGNEPVIEKLWKSASFTAQNNEEQNVSCYYEINIAELDESESRETIEACLDDSELNIKNNEGFSLEFLTEGYTITKPEKSDVVITSVSLTITNTDTSESVGSVSLKLMNAETNEEITEELSISEDITVAVNEVE